MRASLSKRIGDKTYLIKANIINFFFHRILKKPHLKSLSFSLLIVNFLFQRIFRINARFIHSIHYTSKIEGSENIIIPEKNNDSVLISFAASGGCYFSIFNNTVMTI